MRRSLLLTASALGLLICLVGGTGLFAALSDTAHTGTNSFDTAALPGSADLKLATANPGPTSGFACDTFSDNLATGLITFSGAVPTQSVGTLFCIQNLGSATVSLSAAIDQLTDVELACTGDEADYGDTSCGAGQSGELAPLVEVRFTDSDCQTGAIITQTPATSLSSLTVTPAPIGTLAPNGIRCFGLGVYYAFGAAQTAVQQAQSDQVTWRFVFTGQS